MVSIREIADDNSSISSTRWAFAAVIKFDIFIIFILIITGLVSHFIGKPLDNSFYGSVTMLLGVLTGLATTTKALQGFEPKDRFNQFNTESKTKEIIIEQKTKPAKSEAQEIKEPEIFEGK